MNAQRDPRDFAGFKLAEPVPEGSFMKPDEGARRRDVGHESALSHFIVELVQFEIVNVIRTSPALEATSDDVLESLTQATRDSLAAYPSVMGACFRKLALEGKIVDTGRMVRSRRPEARKRKIAVWRAP